MSRAIKTIAPVADIMITVPGPLRYWVAEALFDAPKLHADFEELTRKQRARYVLRKPRLSIADGLRDLAAKIGDR